MRASLFFTPFPLTISYLRAVRETALKTVKKNSLQKKKG